MGISYHPPQGSIIKVDFDGAFRLPEMVKPRLCVVLSKQIKARVRLCTVVPLSTTAPVPVMPYHLKVEVPFALPERWGNQPRWLKGDMIYSVSFARVDLLVLGKNFAGKRFYQIEALPEDLFRQVQRCVLHGLGIEELTFGLPITSQAMWRLWQHPL